MKILFCGLLFLSCLLSKATYDDMDAKKFVVIIPSYNNSQWFEKNISSILSQNYSNFRVIYIDDCSSDGTADLVAHYVSTINNSVPFNLIRNQQRMGALRNLYDVIHSCDDNDIIVLFDGDDWAPDNTVLARLNIIYSTKDVWITHGRMIEFPSKWDGWCLPVPRNIIVKNAFRSYRCPTHLRTFYAWLFKKIDRADLLYEGSFFEMTWDQAILFPMFEMAGGRHYFFEDIMYIYNQSNPISDGKKNAKLQEDLECYIRAKKPYKKLLLVN